MQKINVSMGTMGTMGHYRCYVALLQSPIDSPGFADGCCQGNGNGLGGSGGRREC